MMAIVGLVFGTIFLLFVPGLAWSYMFFARHKIDWLERAALSVGLSMSLVPLTVFWANKVLGVGVGLASTLVIASLLILVPVGWALVKRYLRQRFAAETD